MDADSHLAVRLSLPKVLLLAALCMGDGASAVAATASGVMTVSTTVASTCAVGTSTLGFGSVGSSAIQAGNVDATGTVTVNCTTGSSYTIALASGGGAAATLASRKMTSGVNLLNYSIYTSAARITVWGDGTLTSATIPGTGSGTSQSVVAYGRIFAGQAVPAGAYTDTVVVTVTY